MKYLLSIPIIIVFFAIDISLAQELPTLKLEVYKRIDQPARNEVSGIIKSKTFDDTYWVHGDSGTPDRIYAINKDGELVEDDKDYRGVKIKGAKNADWEDIAILSDSLLLIGDIGNNCECRDDLSVLVIKEPEPDAKEAVVIQKYRYEYPKRNDILGWILQSNYNSEALFTLDGEIYLLTKQHRKAILFHFDNPSPDSINILQPVETIRTKHYVTAADVSQEGDQLAILTYNQLIVFSITDESFFDNPIRTAFLDKVEQVESLTFNGDSLIIAEENGDLYEIQIDELAEVDDF